MYNDDYIMLFDENGQPYIEHASLAGIRSAVTGAVRSGVSKLKGMRRPGAKYYARIDDPKRPGDYLYFYSKEEYDRYRENQTRSRTADRELQRLERAVKANPSPKNKAALLSKREEINNAKRQAEESENAARKRSNEVSVGRAIDDAKSNLKSAKSSLGNKVNQAKNTIDQMKKDLRDRASDTKDAIQKTTGIGLKSKAEKERKEANKANSDYNTMLEGYRNASNTGDKAAEEHLGKRVKEYGDTRDREEREARDAENAYNNSWAGKANNMINKARNAGNSAKNTTQDKANDIIKSIKEGTTKISDMSTAQISKLADDLKSAPTKAREYMDAGRDAIKNTTGIGLRETYNTAQQKVKRAEDVMDQVDAELRTAVANGDTNRAKELSRTKMNLSETLREYKQEAKEADKAYYNSIAGRLSGDKTFKDNNESNTSSNTVTWENNPNITTWDNATGSQPSNATIQKLLDKFNAHEKLSTKEMNIIMSFLGGMFNS